MTMEGRGQYSAKAFLHIPTSVVRHECIVSKVTGAEHAAHNLVDIDHASEFSSFSADPITNVHTTSQAFETRGKFLMRCSVDAPNVGEVYGFEPPQQGTRLRARTRVFPKRNVPSCGIHQISSYRFDCNTCQLSRPVNVLLLAKYSGVGSCRIRTRSIEEKISYD